MITIPSARLLGRHLVSAGMLSVSQLEEALEEQAASGRQFGEILVSKGFVRDDDAFCREMARQTGLESVCLQDRVIGSGEVSTVPARFALHYRVMPVGLEDGVLILACADPPDMAVLDGIKLVWPGRVRLVLAPAGEITRAIERYYGVGAATIDAMMDETPAPVAAGPETGTGTDPDSGASIATFLNQVLMDACRRRATDIHFEPLDKDFRIRWRIDGVLLDGRAPGDIRHFRDALVSRLKILARLNIAERRLPQDGRFTLCADGTPLDFRVSILPTPDGESAAVRVLNAARLYDPMDLGLSAPQARVAQELLGRPHGIIFVTGPTGSGKTTTLYAFLSRVADVSRKVVTIEDPVEYRIPGITQIQVNPKIQLTFAAGLRCMLRHDPDIMMVGEVRDRETAVIAVEAALTGHLVFSTLHTNDAAGGITRLLEMGIEPYLVSSAVEAFIAQRLVRRVCVHCRRCVVMPAGVLRESGFPVEGEVRVYEGEGCAACDFTGYHGREGLFEMLVMNDHIRELVAARAPARCIREAARAAGMRSLLDDGWDKILRGVTTVREVLRVTRDSALTGDTRDR